MKRRLKVILEEAEHPAGVWQPPVVLAETPIGELVKAEVQQLEYFDPASANPRAPDGSMSVVVTFKR